MAHHNGVATGDDSAALLVVLTQQHITDVVGRRGSVGGRDDAVTRKVVDVRHGLLSLSGCGCRDGIHLVHAVHMQQWRVMAVVLVVTEAATGTTEVLV